MKNPKERSTAILVGVAAGAILMALMFMIAPLMISRNRQQQKAGIVSERTGAMPRARLERTIRLNMQRLV